MIHALREEALADPREGLVVLDHTIVPISFVLLCGFRQNFTMYIIGCSRPLGNSGSATGMWCLSPCRPRGPGAPTVHSIVLLVQVS